jgi:alkylation response protein AidB-like acyl-CoA dehydrogenase
LLPDIAARAPEIEAARRVPEDLLDALSAAGCFRLLLPETHDGAGADLRSAMQVFETLAAADASVAWIVFIGGGTWIDLAELPRATFDAIYRPGADTIVAGVFNPTGTATPFDGSYRISGRWAFASGCEHADWIYANCVDTSIDAPHLRMAVLRPDEVEIEDTWRVSGLSGTGSHHFSVHDVVVPAERTARMFVDPPCVDVPLVRIPVPATIALAMGAIPLGIARAALDDVRALAAGKVPLLAPSALAANPLFQYRLAEADVRLRAARALLYEEADAAWATAEADEPFEPELRARLRSAAVLAATTAASVVEVAYESGGGSSIYADSPLQRRLRDVRAVAQHFLFRPDTLTTCGAVLAGQQPELSVF